MARLFNLAVLAAVLLAFPAGAVRAHDAENRDAAAPPKSEVEAGLEAAQGHVTRKEQETAAALQTATTAVATAQQAMTAALTSHDIAATQLAYAAFEAAIKQKAAAEAAASGARQLQEMVKTHNALVDRYFESVAKFLENQVQKDESREIADSKDLEDAKQAAQERFEKDSRLEIAGSASLLSIFQELLESERAIKAKDDSLGSPGVHAAVHDGLTKVRAWANGETHQVCLKYQRSTDPRVVAVRDRVPKKNGHVDCHDLIDALAKEFPPVQDE